MNLQDFPGGTVVKNPPASAGDRSSIPGLKRLILCVTTIELVCLESMIHNNEKPRHHKWRVAPTQHN